VNATSPRKYIQLPTNKVEEEEAVMHQAEEITQDEEYFPTQQPREWSNLLSLTHQPKHTITLSDKFLLSSQTPETKDSQLFLNNTQPPAKPQDSNSVQ
jgi:hypothetical protein